VRQVSQDVPAGDLGCPDILFRQAPKSLGPFRGGIWQELYLVEDLLLLALLCGQGKCHVDFCLYIDRLASNRRGLVAALLHRLDRRWREQRVARSHILHRNGPVLPHWVEKPWVASQAVLKLKDLTPWALLPEC